MAILAIIGLAHVAAAQVPSVTTVTATGISATNGQVSLNAQVNPNGHATGVYFKWGPAGNLINTSGVDLIGSGNTQVAVSVPVIGLLSATNYQFQAFATNSAGTNSGAILFFLTPTYPGFLTNAMISGTAFQASVLGTTNAKYGFYVSSNLVDWSLLPPGQFTWFSPAPVTIQLTPAVTNGHWFYKLQ